MLKGVTFQQTRRVSRGGEKCRETGETPEWKTGLRKPCVYQRKACLLKRWGGKHVQKKKTTLGGGKRRPSRSRDTEKEVRERGSHTLEAVADAEKEKTAPIPNKREGSREGDGENTGNPMPAKEREIIEGVGPKN